MLIAIAVMLAIVGVPWTFLNLRRAVDTPLVSIGKFKPPRLHGRSSDDILAEFGTPKRDCEFAIGDDAAWVEFRIELHNFYRPENPDSAVVRIRECQWHYPSYRVAVWFHRVDGVWVALDSCQWDNRLEF